MKIYTKSGDKGKTSIIGGQRVLKSDLRVCAYGSIDEVNSWVGKVIAALTESRFDTLRVELTALQVLLFDIGTDFATPSGINTPIVGKQDLARVEALIDHYQGQVPVIEKFILPGGHPIACDLHVARTVIRRGEREVTALLAEEDINLTAYKIINRLSDLFFVLARYINNSYGITEPFYERAGNVFH